MSRSAAAERSYHHGDLRNALLDAAVALLGEHAPAKLSLRAVARAADVSHAAPYHYFADRGELLKAAGDRCMERFVTAQEQAADGEPDPRERLIAVGRAYVDFAAAEPHAFALVYDPELCPPADPSPERAPLIAANERLLDRCVRDAQAAGWRARADPAQLGLALWAAVHGLATLVMAGHLPHEQAEPALRALLA